MSTPTPATTTARPKGGDIIRLTSRWRWGGLDAGAEGVVQGATDQEHNGSSIIFQHSTYCDAYASSSGGPGTVWTPFTNVVATDEFKTVRYWRWKDRPRADGGVYYDRVVRVWLIAGEELDRDYTAEERAMPNYHKSYGIVPQTQ